MKNILILLMTAALLAGCGKLSNENLSRVKTGMSEVEVKSILGKPSRTETGETLGIRGTTYYYESGGAEVKIVFLNDSVMVKEGSFK